MAANVNCGRLKLLCILWGPGQDVLHHALLRGTNKTNSDTLIEHLDNLPQSSTANYCTVKPDKKKKVFTDPEKNRLNTDASCRTLDITLLYKCIQYACENVRKLHEDWKDEAVMEGLLFKIKDARNSYSHEGHRMIDDQQFKAEAGELRTLFIAALQAIKHRYGVPDADTNHITDKVMKYIDDVLESFVERVILQMTFQQKLSLFKQETAAHLKTVYDKYQALSPLSFLCGSQERVHIQTIFSKLTLKQTLKQQPTSVDIDAFSILKPVAEECASDPRPRLAVVSGVAGSGKTTLLTFILSEWVKDECDRRVAHLDRYDIVLRVQCRDRDATRLDEFLALGLPPSLGLFSEPLTQYLQHSKVLYLVDGIDEMNSTSSELVSSILTAGKYAAAQWSVLATSRPERVDQFLACAGQDYRQWQIFVEGIPPASRVEFALRYCASTSQDRLREVIIRNKDNKLFELPLNLVFLVALVQENHEYMKEENITQVILYTKIHEWCTEKLCVRILAHPTWGERRPATLKTRVKRAVSELCRTALHCLLQDKLTLSEQDTEWLANRCEAEDLPAQDVLGAFLTLQLSSTGRVRQQHYCLPHKGMMEFLAARHIMQRLQAASPPGPGAVMSLLQDAAHPPARPLDLVGLRNLFVHVAGLLATEQVPNHQATTKEIVELVGKTAARWREWLALVDDTQKNECFLEAIAHHITLNTPHGKPRITDSTLASAAALLPRTPPTTVNLALYDEKANVDIVRALTPHRCANLQLCHHYKHPGNTPASDPVLRAIDRSGLIVFDGQLSDAGVALLPESLEWLRLAVGSDEQAASVTAALARQASSLPRLQHLDLHVAMAMVTPAVAPSPLPAIRDRWGSSDVRLALSGVDSGLMREACRVVAALQPEPGYKTIGFPGARMEAAEWRELLHLLQAAQVRVKECVVIPEETITQDDEIQLRQLSRSLLGCMVYRASEWDCFSGILLLDL